MNIDSIYLQRDPIKTRGRPRKPDKKGGYQRTTKPKLRYKNPEKKIYNKFSIAELSGEKFVRAANELIKKTLARTDK